MGCDESSALVADAQHGDRRAREALGAHLLKRMRRIARGRCRSVDVDDAAQVAVCEVLRSLSNFRAEGPFDAWADRIGRRHIARHAARARREPPIGEREASHFPTPEHHLDARRLCAGLPSVQAESFVLHHGSGWSVPELALELGVSVETVRSRLRLARRRLRASLDDMHVDSVRCARPTSYPATG